MSEMIERVAKAIYEEDDPWHKAWPWPDLNESQGSPEPYRRIAAAAIKAMREGRPNPDWQAAAAAIVALAEHGIGADIGELLTHGNPLRGIAPGAIFKMISAIDAALVGEG
ncbi:hypothetical protein HH800_05915 [Sphingobium yanoikuyae]|uniref:Uncharacterized protein n=1 Tax=Sphingobium yanoikuyae TaxID=13690 RepID=A0A6M4G683_SPHYA|nr:hypothetical protein [Sphingobium yanoikuyae]QJR01773.1 hypothetical protein HH800_05915 [Sphingobium yanoikuyae]